MHFIRSGAALVLSLSLFSTAARAAGSSVLQDNVDKVGFANPHLLLSTQWLADHDTDKGVVIVDARRSGDYESAHVPGSVSIPATATSDPATRWSLGSAEHMAELLGGQGISAASHVVVYDGGKSTAAARVFWALEVYGHAKVSVVDGGFPKWKAEKRDDTDKDTAVTKVEYKIGKPNKKLSTGKDVLSDVKQEGAVMLDARSAGEYKSGRIPEAVRIEWSENFTADKVAVFRSPSELLKLYADQGVTPNKRVHAY